MTDHSVPRWLQWAREIQALAQSGETFSQNRWQSQRYQRLMEIAAEIVSEHTHFSVEPIYENFKAQTGYATPKVDVRGAVFQDGKLLLVRERTDDCWTLPGGWADVGDSPASAVEREVWEESGYEVRASKLIGIYDANRVKPLELYHAVKLVFLCEIQSGEATPSDETSEVAFFETGQIPADLSEERTNSRHIRDALTAYSNSAAATVFE